MSNELSELSEYAKHWISRGVESALAIDAPAFEEDGDVLILLEQAQVALSTTREAFGEILRRLDEFAGERPLALLRLADATFVGRVAIGGLSAELKRTESRQERWAFIRAASKVRRELLRSLRSADLLVCQVLGCEPDTSYYLDELQHGLATRLAYAKLRLESERALGEELEVSLRRAATTLAKLVGRRCYPELRIHDRMLIRQLQGRIRCWLSEGTRTVEAELAGQRLLGEYHNFVEIALEVNKRPELIEHDRLLLTQLLVVWSEVPPSELGRELSPLLGRDKELDRMLGAGVQDRAALRECVEQVLGRLGGSVSKDSWNVESAHPVSRVTSTVDVLEVIAPKGSVQS